MEVHHHPHVEKKNFKEYLLEGLMIFLAVTMGFFAESLREYFGDREKESHYMHSMVEDLKKDTAALHYSIRRLEENMACSKIFLVSIANNTLNAMSDIDILKLSRNVGNSVDIIFNDRTSSQLKNSGSIRLIKNKSIADSLLQYWNNQIWANQIHERYETVRLEKNKIGYKKFSWYKFEFSPNYLGADSTIVNAMPAKAIIKPENLPEFLNATGNLFISGSWHYVPILNRQLALATYLIKEIEKNYSREK
jgi:hypothetical protein